MSYLRGVYGLTCYEEGSHEHDYCRRLLLYWHRSVTKKILEEGSGRSSQTTAAELYYLRHLRSAACASSGSQCSAFSSVTAVVSLPLLFLTGTDWEKVCKYVAWAVMGHTFQCHWREWNCYISFAFIVLLYFWNFHCKHKQRCQVLSVLMLISCMHQDRLEVCIGILGGIHFPFFPPTDNMLDEDDDIESITFSDTSLSDESTESDNNDDSELQCSPCLESNLSEAKSSLVNCLDCELPVDTRDDESIDSLSDVSDNSDIFHVAPSNDIPIQTLEDQDIEIISKIKQHLRSYPLLPAKQTDDTGKDSFDNLSSGMQLPLLTCGFLNCNWHYPCSMSSHRSLEQHLYCHLRRDHKDG